MDAPTKSWKPAGLFQKAVLSIPDDVKEEFYPGGRGSGKTQVIEVKALLHCMRYPGAKVGWYRQNLTDAEDLITELDEFCTIFGGAKGKFLSGGKRKKWTFPNGSTLSVMYLNRDQDGTQGQGSGKTMIVFDEVGKYNSPFLIDKLRGSLRSGTGIPCKMIFAANPAGPGHTWLKERYMNHEPYKIFELRVHKDAQPVKCVWMPSTIRDNPHIDHDEYVAQLSAITVPWLRDAWLNNDWSVNPGSFWGDLFDPARHVIRPKPIRPNWRRMRSMDWGFAMPYAIGWWAIDEEGNMILTDELYGVNEGGVEGVREPATQVAARMNELEERRNDQHARWYDSVADVPGDFGLRTSVIEAFSREGVRWRKNTAQQGSNYRVNTVQEITTRLNNTLEGRTNGLLFFDRCKKTIEQMRSIPADERDPEDVDTKAPDHAVDMVKMAVNVYRGVAPDIRDYRRFARKARDERNENVDRLLGFGDRMRAGETIPM